MNQPASFGARLNEEPVLPNSLPALRHALLQGRPLGANAPDALDALRGVVPVYRIGRNLDIAGEAEQALHVVRHFLDRMGRLRGAYGEWRTFDAPAYFDLTHEQCALLLEINERVAGVHILAHVDLLLPSMQEAVALWMQIGPPPHVSGSILQEEVERYAEQSFPELTRRWERAVAVAHATRTLLSGDADYLAANGAAEERWRWQERESSARNAIALAATPIAQIPTLALTIDFPLPAWRQAGRLRRLQRNRAHRNRRRHNRGSHT